jgi:cell division inhibitor SulA/protein ImuA
MNTARDLHHLNAADHPLACGSSLVTPSGCAVLDDMLPGGGWPKGGVVELIVPDDYAEAIDLVMPALRRLSWQGRWITLVTPPLPSRAAVFTDQDINANRVLQVNPHPGRSALWTVESMLRTGDCAALLAWPGCDTELMDKRLQKAAEQGRSLCVLFRYASVATHPSGVDFRLQVEVSEGGRAVYRVNSHGEAASGIAL